MCLVVLSSPCLWAVALWHRLQLIRQEQHENACCPFQWNVCHTHMKTCLADWYDDGCVDEIHLMNGLVGVNCAVHYDVFCGLTEHLNTTWMKINVKTKYVVIETTIQVHACSYQYCFVVPWKYSFWWKTQKYHKIFCSFILFLQFFMSNFFRFMNISSKFWRYGTIDV